VPKNKEERMKKLEEEQKGNYRGTHGGNNIIDP
jgi:hypothetical protein